MYYKSPTGVFAKCLSKKEAHKRLDEVHNQICGMEGAPLGRRLLRARYYWDSMQKNAQEKQRGCNVCKMEITKKEVVLLVEVNDWQKPHLMSLSKGLSLRINQKK